MGARKFVVFDIEAIGCLPMYVNQLKPLKSKCVDELNTIVLKFNKKLRLKIQELDYKLPGSMFVVGKNYRHILNLVQNPQNYGKFFKFFKSHTNKLFFFLNQGGLAFNKKILFIVIIRC